MTTNTRFPLILTTALSAILLASGCGGGGLSANPLSPNDDSLRGINGRGGSPVGSLDDNGGLDDNGTDDNGLRGDGSVDDNGHGLEVEREQRITGLTPDSVTLGGVTFLVTPQTSITNKRTGAPMSFSELQVNMPIDAKGYSNDGAVTATRIRVR